MSTHRNYHDYDARQVSCFTIPGILTLLAIITYALRGFTRIKIVKHFGPEDWCCLVALCADIALTAIIFAETYYGMGLHIQDVDLATTSMMFKLFWASVWIYNIALTLTKISILVQYTRIFAVSSVRVVCWIVLGCTAAFGVWSVLGNVFMCTPVQYWWNKSIQGHCLDEASVWLSNSAINMCTDVIIVLIPLPVVYQLCIPTKQKCVVAILFILGGFGCITSALRLKSVITIARSPDPTWDNVSAAIWSSVEVNVALICACIATLKPLVSKYLPKVFSVTGSLSDAIASRAIVDDSGATGKLGSFAGGVVAGKSAGGHGEAEHKSTASSNVAKVGGAVFGSFSFAEDDSAAIATKGRSKSKITLRSMSFSEHDGTMAASSPSTPRKSVFGSFSFRRASAWSRNSMQSQIPVDLEMQANAQQPHDTIHEEDGSSLNDTEMKPYPMTMPTKQTSATNSGALTELNNDDEDSEQDLYHAMLRTQTQESHRSRAGGSAFGIAGSGRRGSAGALAGAGIREGRRPSVVAFALRPQYEEIGDLRLL